jgi:hypothetical protein
MELKVQCDCGQKYKFDVEPVNGQMPWDVKCPVCGLSGTDKANWLLQHQPAAAPIPVAVPPPLATPVSAEPPKPRLVLNRATAPAPASAPPPVVTPHAVPRTLAAPAKPAAAKGSPSLALGALGAVAGGLIGMGIWYGITVATGREFGLIAWAVGGLVGFGARVLGKSGSTGLGLIAGLCATLSIVGGGFLAAQHEVGKFMNEAAREEYQSELARAKEAANLQTDAEIKTYLAKTEFVGAGEDVTADAVQSFKRTELPKLQAIASGKTSEQQFETDFKTERRGIGLLASVIGTFSLWTLLWLFFGVGTAYRLGASTG